MEDLHSKERPTVKDLKINDTIIGNNNNVNPDPAPKVRIKVPLIRTRIRKKYLRICNNGTQSLKISS